MVGSSKADTGRSRLPAILDEMDSVYAVLSELDGQIRALQATRNALLDSLQIVEQALSNQNRVVARLDSQYRIIERERQPLLRLLTQSVLAHSRCGKWALIDALLGSHDLSDFLNKRSALSRLRTAIQHRSAGSIVRLREIQDLEDASLDEAKRLNTLHALVAQQIFEIAGQENRIELARHEANHRRKVLMEQQTFLEKSDDLLKKQVEQRASAASRVADIIESQGMGLVADTVFANMRGSLPWPVEGSLLSGFGKRRHKKLETVTENPGIDVKTEASIPVRSVASGTVNSVSWLRGFGNVCIVRHEGEHFSVYARLGEVVVRQGDFIRAGDVVGFPGFDSEHANYIVHFEIWAGKDKQDPIAWLTPVKNK